MTPLKMRIPKQLEEGFVKVISLSNESFLELMSALEEAPATYKPDSIAVQLLAKTKQLSAVDINDIVTAILSLQRLREDSGLSEAELIEQVASAMEETDNKQLLLEDENRTRFKLRVTSLLNCVFLSTLGRILSLINEYAHVFGEVRVLTDIRSAFISQPEDQPKAAIITHMLRIGYLDNGEPKNFYVALDSSDITKIIDALERAKKKAKALKTSLKPANISIIDVE
jgi:hypothetical protein